MTETGADDRVAGDLTKAGALATGVGLLELIAVQPEGKRPMPGAALVAGLARDARRLDPR